MRAGAQREGPRPRTAREAERWNHRRAGERRTAEFSPGTRARPRVHPVRVAEAGRTSLWEAGGPGNERPGCEKDHGSGNYGEKDGRRDGAEGQGK